MAYFGKETGGRSLSRPMGSLTTRDRYALVDGERLRMLHSREYLLAQRFRHDYHLTGKHKDDVRLVGNSVAPPVARAVVAALKDRLCAAGQEVRSCA
jgi:DNA (cytosine-5)-methyltransferase 1